MNFAFETGRAIKVGIDVTRPRQADVLLVEQISVVAMILDIRIGLAVYSTVVNVWYLKEWTPNYSKQ